MKTEILKKILRIKNKFKGKKLNLHEPSISYDDIKTVSKALKDKELSTYGKYTPIFEKKISKIIKSKNVISIINGTSALHLALKMLNININDEVLVPSLTFVSSINSIIYNGAQPHFVEIDPENLAIDIKKLDKYLNKIITKKGGKNFNKKTGKELKFLMLVHLNGLSCNIDLLKKVLRKYNIKLIEDAAEAFGSFYKGKHLGTFGEAGVFSFNGNKILTTGGGGAIVFKDMGKYKQALNYASNCKVSVNNEINYKDVGFNYRLPSINASLGISQLKKIYLFKKNKKKIFNFYKKIFFKDKYIKLLEPRKNLDSNYWLNTIILKNSKLLSKKKLMRILENNKIFARSIWKPVHLMKAYKHYQSMNLKETESIYKKSITLPSSPFLWRKKID